jgi:antitoxin component YwqK of YwqJK toxin-antitoxin module
MKSIIFILAMVFFISECNADSRVLEQLKSEAHHRAKKSVSKNKKPKKTVNHKKIVLKEVKPKEIVPPKEIVSSEELDIRNDLAYLPNEDKPFSGKYKENHSNGKKYIEIKYKDGKRNGVLIMWDEYGHKIGELNFENGSQL